MAGDQIPGGRKRRRSRLRILQVGTIDEGGGAAAVATGLMRGYRARGHRTWLVVGRKHGSDPAVLVIPEDRRLFYRVIGYPAVQVRLRRLAGRFPNRGFGLISRLLRLATHPRVMFDHWRGREDFDFPGSYAILDMLDSAPDVAHCHNLHGGYFDLRALESLSARLPTVLTLHDMWLLTGHCAYSLSCQRWRTGCGNCPALDLDPAIQADATAANWTRKRGIYERSRLYVATPSQWLMDKVNASMLAPSLAGTRVIPNGVDLDVFRPADRRQVRATLGLPLDAPIVLVTTGSLGSMWKDDRTVIEAVRRVEAQNLSPAPVFVSVGRDSAVPRDSVARVRSIPFQTDPRAMAQYYQAADLYLHAARADTAPLTVLEAMACGTPVVATTVGGIPEQIRALDVASAHEAEVGSTDATGVLVPGGDARGMAAAAAMLIERPALRAALGANGAHDVAQRFSLDLQVDRYVEWYREIIGGSRTVAGEQVPCAAQA